MAKVRIGRKSFDGPQSVGKPVMQTVFANEASRRYADEAAAVNGKVYFMPGQIQDTDFVDTVFASYGGRMDKEQPIARLAIASDKEGRPEGTFHFYDKWGEILREYRTAVASHVKNGMTLTESAKRATIALADIVSTQHIVSTKSINILDRVLGLQTRNYLLRSVVTTVPAPNLVFSVDTFTEGNVEAKVPEMQEPKLIGHEESRTTKTLYKNVGHIAISEETELMQSHNTMAIRQDWTVRDMNRLINAQLATELELATATGGSDWGATSGTPPQSTNSPYTDLTPRGKAIKGAGFKVDFIAVDDIPAGDIAGNTFLNGRGFTGPTGLEANAEMLRVAGLPPIYIDQALTDTIAIYGSMDATWLGQGPTIVASYGDDLVGYRGWLVKQYWLPYLAQPTAISKLTGISA